MLILYVGKGKKYANIESALSDCTEGGTIMVSPGRYRESLKVKVPDVTIAAAKKAGVLGKLDYVSTAGGAFLEFMEGRKLPGVEALIDKVN